MSSSNPAADPLAFGRQLWQQWSDALQQSSTPAGAVPDWSAALHQWSNLASPAGDAKRAAEKLSAHAQPFMAMLQQLTQMAAGSGANPPDLAALWRSQIGDSNPMLDAMRQISAEGARGWEQLLEGASGAASPAVNELLGTLKLPAFGMNRERQAQLSELVSAQAAQVEANLVYQKLLAKASEAGMQRFESKLAEHSEPGRQIGSARALYDLWIDAAEEAYAQQAVAPEFRSAYGKLVNTQMRVKQLQQREVERATAELGMPTRSELDGVLRRIHDLQREVRSLRGELARSRLPVAAVPATSSTSSPPAKAKSATSAKKSAAKAAAKSSKSAKPAPKPTVGKKVVNTSAKKGA